MTLQEFREMNNLNKYQIARKLKVDYKVYSRWESGESKPSLKNFIKLRYLSNYEISIFSFFSEQEIEEIQNIFK